jgi:uncharacterized short protein YbdD (DUF466 family)
MLDYDRARVLNPSDSASSLTKSSPQGSPNFRGSSPSIGPISVNPRANVFASSTNALQPSSPTHLSLHQMPSNIDAAMLLGIPDDSTYMPHQQHHALNDKSRGNFHSSSNSSHHADGQNSMHKSSGLEVIEGDDDSETSRLIDYVLLVGVRDEQLLAGMEIVFSCALRDAIVTCSQNC